jgi:hypothetical protein
MRSFRGMYLMSYFGAELERRMRTRGVGVREVHDAPALVPGTVR